MRSSRRAFLQTLGLASAGTVAAPLIGGRGHEALAAVLRRDPQALPPELTARATAIRISSNENPRGPSAAALDGIRAALGESSRYPFASPGVLREAVARRQGLAPEQVLLGCGSTELLKMAVDAFVTRERGLVTASPTFEDVAERAELLGAPVLAVPVDAALRLDLDAMAQRARGAGMVYVNNPNNPTGTLHGADAITEFVQRVRRESPGTMILIDEAYFEYVLDPAYATALPLALAHPEVVVLRTFSKVYGMAGLRVGYAMGRKETLARMAREQTPLSLNALGVAAALGALQDDALVPREQRLNREAREWAMAAFSGAGFAVVPSQANFFMVDVRRDTRAFQEACRARDVLVGRPFPPLRTHARLSVGTMEEMRAAVPVCLEVLGARATATGGSR